MTFRKTLFATAVVFAAAAPPAARAQTMLELNALQGLAPFAVLGNTEADKAALAANLRVTETIQTGTAGQKLLLPFPAQQQQALRDAFITIGNAEQLSDGLGTQLGGAYQAMVITTDSQPPRSTDISPHVAALLAYAAALSGADSNSAKFFFAEDMQKPGKAPAVPASAAAQAILAAEGGTTDVYGKAYGRPAGSAGADPAGDSRPFQVDPDYVRYDGPDYFGAASSNIFYLAGPAQDLVASPAFPSGHTTYGYTDSVLLAVMVPERYQQMIARGAEYGNDRIVLGAHYAMDVIGGRTLALYDLAHLLANDSAYLNQTLPRAPAIGDFAAALAAARADLRAALATKCGAGIAACAPRDESRFESPAANEALYESTQTYGLPVVYPARAGKTEDVAKLAPQAGYLLKAAFPTLSLALADRILTITEGPGGGFLDNGSAFGVYSRLDLYKAAGLAKR